MNASCAIGKNVCSAVRYFRCVTKSSLLMALPSASTVLFTFGLQVMLLRNKC